MSNPRVVLKTRRARPFFGMHPWVYAGAIDSVVGSPSDGAVVDLHAHDGSFVARGLFNSQSKIRVRLCSWSQEESLDNDFFRRRLETAIHLRRDVLRLMGPKQACRLVFSEADSLSGLTVDLIDRWIVVQFTSLALAQRRDLLADLLVELLQPEGIYLRTERGIGHLERLELQDGPLRGPAPTAPIVIEEHGLHMQVHLTEGQKTGYYLDQRDNRLAVARLACGRRMLDAFCYSGSFGLHAARAGAAMVLGIDASEPALQLARANAQLNGLTNVAFEKSDVFHRLGELAKAQKRFGVIVLDPPKFARSASAVEEAMRGYRRLLGQAVRVLEAGGILVLCCCSGLITRDMLHELLALEASQARRLLQILEWRGAAQDHPVAATCPETNYLQCIICRIT